jgi:UDP-GlcNAc3NAcA epimerase
LKILTVIGARPQFVKAAVVSRELASVPGVEERMLHTGQHYDDSMSARFFEELALPEPAWNLGVGSGPHGVQTARMLEGIEAALSAWRPDRVLVYGDTNSTLAGALCASKQHVPCAHVEAGLRSFNRRMPEEVNRVVADVLSDLLFCPTRAAVANLRAEGRGDASGVRLVGDVMYDAVRLFGGGPAKVPAGAEAAASGRFALATCHRAENTDDPARLAGVLAGLGRVACRMPVVFPAHPRTVAAIRRDGLSIPDGVAAIDPASYLEMLSLLSRAALVLTDSGGLQKEAFFAGAPCVTLRDETEWVELVEAGWNRLAGADPDTIRRAADELLDRPSPPPRPDGLYGDGRAAARIADALAGA